MQWSRRMKKISREYSLFSVIGLSAVVLVLYNEYFCFVWSRLHWASIPAPAEDASSELRILLVADPQLVGSRDESQTFGFITRWDCDSYLQTGFRAAFSYVRPDVILFLGDLLDEGSVTPDRNFEAYVQRFQAIFKVPSDIQRIFIPGDNDVGGEGFESKQDSLVNRFFEKFEESNHSSDAVVHSKFVDFFKLSYDLGETFAAKMKRSIERMIERSKAPFRVICNHMGVFIRHPSDYSELVAAAKPSLFISAHTHKAVVYHCYECEQVLKYQSSGVLVSDSTWRSNITLISGSSVFKFRLNGGQGIVELVVPTCSYRMGTDKIGYGVAVIGSNGHLEYSVLWLPSRYPLLYAYLYFVCASSGCFVIYFLIYCIRSPHKKRPGIFCFSN